MGPVDDGTESLGDVPSLSEEVTGTDEPLPEIPDTPEWLKKGIILYLLYFVYFHVISGAAAEFKPSDVSVETVLSEEGHQVGA